MNIFNTLANELDDLTTYSQSIIRWSGPLLQAPAIQLAYFSTAITYTCKNVYSTGLEVFYDFYLFHIQLNIFLQFKWVL